MQCRYFAFKKWDGILICKHNIVLLTLPLIFSDHFPPQLFLRIMGLSKQETPSVFLNLLLFRSKVKIIRMGSWEKKKKKKSSKPSSFSILWKENLAVWGCIWVMSHPTFIICPSETGLLSSPICLRSFFCSSNCTKETLFEIGKYDTKLQTPGMSEVQRNAQSWATLNSLIFSMQGFRMKVV